MLSKIVVTGANGLVGSAVCRALREREADVVGIVRRAGTAPQGVTEVVGEFYDPAVAAQACQDAEVVIHTAHPMSDDEAEQRAPHWAGAIAQAAADAGAKMVIYVSSTSVYRREADTPDIDENSALVGDDGNAYAVSKRRGEEAVAAVEGITRVLVRPTAVLGAGESSVWNSVRPQKIREGERTEDPERTWGWVHVDDLADLIADIATDAVAVGTDPTWGPVEGGVTAVNAVTESLTMRFYHQLVCDALGIEPIWETRQAFGAQLLAYRARKWGWNPRVTWEMARAELAAGLRQD